MHFTEISNIRLALQNLTVREQTTVQGLVEYMGALQAQDYLMVQLAVGKRLSNITDKKIDLVLNEGKILRTHLLRPTWHIVSSKDIYWILQLTAPHIKTAVRSRHKELELNEKVLSKIYLLLERSLRDENHLTRNELYSIFHEAKISTENNRGAHILLSAELEGIICSGKIKDGKQTFALLEERVPKPAACTRDEALEKLAKIYFESRSPATLRDFVWWSGLPVRDARKAIEMIRNDFISEEIEEETYLIPNSLPNLSQKNNSVFLLPAFDEFLIAYSNRKAAIENDKKAISQNGIFWAIIVVNGQVIGLWKRTKIKDKILVSVDPFKPLKKHQMELLEKEVVELGHFWGKETILK